MAISYYSSVNLHKNELQNFVVHNTNSISSPEEGQMYYDTDVNTIYFNSAATGETAVWVDIGVSGDITGVTATGGLTGGGTSGAVTVKRASGFVSIDNHALTSVYNRSCDYFKSTHSGFFSNASTNTDCAASTGLNLPDKATITSMTCILHSDYDSSELAPSVVLEVHGLGAVPDSLVTLSAEPHQPLKQTLTRTGLSVNIDNMNSSYRLTFNSVDTDIAHWNHRFYNCTIGYTYP